MRALPEGIRVERATADDADRVHAIVHEGISSYMAWAPDWRPVEPTPEQRQRIRANFDDPAVWVLLAFDASHELVGVVSIAAKTLADPSPLPPGTVYLWQMFVRPAWHGRGLAGALHDLLVEEARRRGFRQMILWAAEGAQQARRFYEREGWRLTGKRDPDSKFGLPIIQYQLDL